MWFLLLLLCAQEVMNYNVHLISHSHVDVGWLQPVQNYQAYTDKILSGVVDQLLLYPELTFNQAETCFFVDWYERQNKKRKKLVMNLMRADKFALVGGGWVQNDEACPTYQDIIDQHTYGLRKINELFGKSFRPNISWQIDSFGYSLAMASILAAMNYKTHVINRVSYDKKQIWASEKSFEFIWDVLPLSGEPETIFTFTMRDHYNLPISLKMTTWNDIISFSKNESQMLDSFNLIEEYISRVSKQHNFDDIYLLFGDDTTYKNAKKWYSNVLKLIQFSKNRSSNVYQSTTFKNLISEIKKHNVGWNVRRGDFFPYMDVKDAFWTGFYTSRSSFKRYIRISSNFLRTSKMAASMLFSKDVVNMLEPLIEAVAVAQHHDAITGTEKQHVADDYSKRLANGQNKAIDVFSHLIHSYLNTKERIYHCSKLNVSQCRYTANNIGFSVILINSLPFTYKSVFSIPSSSSSFIVSSCEAEILADVLPTFIRQSQLKNMLPYTVHFEASIPPLGMITLNFLENQGIAQTKKTVYTIYNDYYKINFNPKTGLIAEIFSLIGSYERRINVENNFYYYDENNFLNSNGAYLLGVEDTPQKISEKANLEIFATENSLVYEARQTFSELYSQTVRLKKGSPLIEFEYTVGPIEQKGISVISRFDTNMNNKGKYYTDINGIHKIERLTKKNYKDTGRNYYPLTTFATMNDSYEEFAIFVERTHGVASMKTGSLEIMLDRNSLDDDRRGLASPLVELNEGKESAVRGSLFVSFGDKNTIRRSIHKLSSFINNDPIILFSNPKLPLKTKAFLSKKLDFPFQLKLLTYEPYGTDTKLLIRIEFPCHEIDCDSDIKIFYSMIKLIPPTVNKFCITEMILSGDIAKTDGLECCDCGSDTLTINFAPLQIRTFLIEL